MKLGNRTARPHELYAHARPLSPSLVATVAAYADHAAGVQFVAGFDARDA